MEKEVKIAIPQGYEVDKENSTFECIKFKKKQEIKTWEDLISAAYNIFLTKKQAKSAFAMAQISRLMPYYGGEITDEEWKDDSIDKYVIYRDGDKLATNFIFSYSSFHFVAFHTKEQRNEFLKCNERLVKNYFMID